MSLAERKAYARHTRAAEEVMRDKMTQAKELVAEERESKKSIAGGELKDSCCIQAFQTFIVMVGLGRELFL